MLLSFRFPLFLGVAMSLGMGAVMWADPPAPALELLTNGSFEIGGPRGLADGWKASGPLLETRLDTQDRKHGKSSQYIRSRGNRALMIWQDVPVKPATDYVVSMWVKSDDRVEVRLGRRRMAYNRQSEGPEGAWQKLVGGVRSGTSRTLKLAIFLGGLTQHPDVLRLDNARLRKAPPLSLPPRKMCPDTVLVNAGAPKGAIIYPAGSPIYARLVRNIQAQVSELTNAALPAVTDTEATAKNVPILLPEYRSKNLILLGRLGNNRALWPAYNHFLCAADGYYPGGDGYVVRTASNVLRNGHNHVILGGSTDKGVARAVEVFLRILGQRARGKTLTLPWLLEVELGGACLDTFRKRDSLWATDPFHKLLPPVEPGYGTVRRWHQNAMGWYWSGWKSYRRRATDLIAPVLKDQARTHHYIIEFFVRTWDMVDDGPLFDEKTRAKIDALIFKNFREFLTGPDLTWMTLFAPPFDSIHLTNRHSIAPWMADLTMADFFHDYFPLKGDLKEWVEYRRQEKHAFMQYLVRERWGPSLPGPNGSSHRDEIVAAMFRYALEHERYEFFTSGHARNALGLERLDHLTGLFVKPSGPLDHHLLLGILAHWYRDGRYVELLRHIPVIHHVTGPFMGRYVNGVRRYSPGSKLKPESPISLAGIRKTPFSSDQVKQFPKLRLRGFLPPSTSVSETAELVSLRSGFGREDDFLAVAGMAGNALPGAILDLTSQGVGWLRSGSSPSFGRGANQYLEQNAVYVLRTDHWPNKRVAYPSAAKVEWISNDARRPGFAVSLEPFMGTRWVREVRRVQPGSFEVHDSIQALEDGRYLVAINWRPQGVPSWDGHTWTSLTDKGMFRITLEGKGFSVIQNVDAARRSPGTELVFRFSASTPLRKGDILEATTHLRASPRRGQPLPAPGSPRPPQHSTARDQTRDHTSRWQQQWQYEGLLRPARIRQVRRIEEGLVDLGKVYHLAEIRAVLPGPLWASTTLPERIETALPNPKVRGDFTKLQWRPLAAERRWRPSVETGNYGRAIPTAQAFQVVYPQNLSARYVRAEGAEHFIYYDRDRRQARRPLRLVLDDLDRNGTDEIFLSPLIWPKFIRKRQEEDDTVALLDASSKELFQWDAPVNIQSVKLLDTDGDGRQEIVAVTVDGRIRCLDRNGRVRRSWDLFAMHQEFQRKEGRPNTRHPAGGLTMPYDFGLWRPGPDGRRKMIVSRYGWCSFIDRKGSFEGVLTIGGYVSPAMLPYGLDFNRDGREEQLCLVRGAVIHLDGTPKPFVADPGGALFFPQVYSFSRVREPAWDERVDGPRPLVFQPLHWGEGPPTHVLIIRENYLGIYDAVKKKWAFTWVPLSELRSAAILEDGTSELAILATTKDDVLWCLRWKKTLERLDSFEASPTPDMVHRITACPGLPASTLLCGVRGIYRYAEEQWSLLIRGTFQDARYSPDKGGERPSIYAIDAAGRVLKFTAR